MALLPTGPQFGVKYTLTGPDGTVVTFNDPSDANNIGVLSEITGFDSPEVIESADNLVQMDGGIHGDFFYGRRPITMSGKIIGFADTTARNMNMTKLMQATNAMRSNATLTWTPDGGGAQQFVALRRQQPLKISGAWVKDFQISLVAADPRVYSATLHSQTVNASGTGGSGGFSFPMTFNLGFGAAVVTGQTFVTNSGSTESWPIYTITGPGTNPSIYNATTNKTLAFIYSLNAGETLVVDTLNRTVFLNGTASRYSALDFTNSKWGGLVPGVNDVRLQFFSFGTGASIRVDWRDAWI
jgi:hypothetical protein